MPIFTDNIAIPSTRTITVDGYLTAPAVLARAGVFKYSAGELGLSDRKPTDVVPVYRSAEALQKAVDGFESQTVTLDHKWTTAANWRDNAIGDVRDVEMRGDKMIGTLIIRDAEAIKAIDANKMTQLSNGYAAKLVRKAGKHLGMDYEYEQTDLHGNHIAIVTAGRCGQACRVADHALSPNQKETTMITRTYDGMTVTLQDQFTGEVFDHMAHLLQDARQELATLKTAAPMVRFGDCELDAGGVRSLVQQKDAEIAAIKDALAHRPGSVTELEDEDPYMLHKRRLVATSGAGDASQIFTAKHMSTPQQEAVHWSARAQGLRDSGKMKIVTSDHDSRLEWMDRQSGDSILTRRPKAV